jgi:SpoVK/Ycf46/Vps4 family AAA+-type ATPase
VVFIDELDRIDQVPARLDRNPAYLRSQLPMELLQFMSDTSLRGQVLWIGATNRPDKLEMSVRRLGTFDDKLPFLVPDASERAEILQKLFLKNQIPYDNQIDFTKPASDEVTGWHTGAELEVIVNRSYRLTRSSKRDRVSQEDLLKAAADFIPGYAVEIYEFISLLALREVNSKMMLPLNLPSDLKEKIYENGTLSKWKVEQRIKELEPKVGV